MKKRIFVAPGGHELLTGPTCVFDVTHSLFTVHGSDLPIYRSFSLTSSKKIKPVSEHLTKYEYLYLQEHANLSYSRKK